MQKTIRNAASLIALAALVIALGVFTTPAQAQWGARIWIGQPAPIFHGGYYHGWDGQGGGNWSDPDNWRPSEDHFVFGDDWDNGNAIVWHGSVDDKVDIYFHGSQWCADVLSGRGLEDEHARCYQPLPFHREHVQLARFEGRGNVFIFQQPNRDNGFTVGVRVYDPQPGRSNYRFALTWD